MLMILIQRYNLSRKVFTLYTALSYFVAKILNYTALNALKHIYYIYIAKKVYNHS